MQDMTYIKELTALTVFSPLLGALISGLFCRRIGERTAQLITIVFMLVSFASAAVLLPKVIFDKIVFDGNLYTWVTSGSFQFNVGFLVDRLTVVMMVIVTFVSFFVHVYSVGYMKGESGNPRFFSYVSLFTFAMLMLVTANNFFQLFFGWEGVGLVSYLLIGFWFKKKAAAEGSMKAFLVNRVGDLGLILGIAAIMDTLGTLDFEPVFAGASQLVTQHIQIFPHTSVSLITLSCILLFIGAMGKSAQIPLHVWLPESMAGPTPISALIHAATMVTAGIYMVARLSPLFTLSPTAMSMILVVGATGGLFLGLLAFVENDIKRVVAYSTMSQLGYMMAANGASAFSAAIYHLMTHACFKALLFLGAGSVIIALHHEQDLRCMGGLWKKLPITYVTFLVGALALTAIPPFSGFYSKELIIDAVRHAGIPGAQYAYICLLLGSFVTAYYIFRAFFMAFHGPSNLDAKLEGHVKESHWTMTLPLVALAIPSLILGYLTIHGMTMDWPQGAAQLSFHAKAAFELVSEQARSFFTLQGVFGAAVKAAPFWLGVLGIFLSWFITFRWTFVQRWFVERMPWLHVILKAGYGFDRFNDIVFVRGVKAISRYFYQVSDTRLIDEGMVNGSGRAVVFFSKWVRRLQTGFLYHYLFVMVVGVVIFFISLWLTQ